MEIHIRKWNSGGSVEGREKTLAKIHRLVEEHFVFRQMVRAEEASKHAYGRLKQIHIDVSVGSERSPHPLAGFFKLGIQLHNVQCVERVDESETEMEPFAVRARQRQKLVVSPRKRLIPLPRPPHCIPHGLATLRHPTVTTALTARSPLCACANIIQRETIGTRLSVRPVRWVGNASVAVSIGAAAVVLHAINGPLFVVPRGRRGHIRLPRPLAVRVIHNDHVHIVAIFAIRVTCCTCGAQLSKTSAQPFVFPLKVIEPLLQPCVVILFRCIFPRQIRGNVCDAFKLLVLLLQCINPLSQSNYGPLFSGKSLGEKSRGISDPNTVEVIIGAIQSKWRKHAESRRPRFRNERYHEDGASKNGDNKPLQAGHFVPQPCDREFLSSVLSTRVVVKRGVQGHPDAKIPLASHTAHLCASG
eukprot:Opistho-2@56189